MLGKILMVRTATPDPDVVLEETDFGHPDRPNQCWPMPILANPFLDLVCVMVGPQTVGTRRGREGGEG